MLTTLNLPYYYGNEADQFSFYRIPKVLFSDVRFKDVSAEAKILYGMMLDRMSLSIKNGWIDDSNRVYIYFTLEDAQELLGCAHGKVTKLFKELDSDSGIGLIERKKQGMGKPKVIFVKNFAYSDNQIAKDLCPPSVHTDVKRQNIVPISGSPYCSKSALYTAENRQYIKPKNGSPYSRLSSGNNTDFSNTEFNYTDSSSSEVLDDKVSKLKHQIEYEYYEVEMPDKLTIVDCLIGIIISLRKEDKPKYRRVLSDIDSITIMEFMEEMKYQNFKKVRNYTAYLQRVFVEFLVKRAADLALIY